MCVCVRMCACVCVYVCVFACIIIVRACVVCVCARARVCVRAHQCSRVYVLSCEHVFVCVCVCTGIRERVRAHACACWDFDGIARARVAGCTALRTSGVCASWVRGGFGGQWVVAAASTLGFPALRRGSASLLATVDLCKTNPPRRRLGNAAAVKRRDLLLAFHNRL